MNEVTPTMDREETSLAAECRQTAGDLAQRIRNTLDGRRAAEAENAADQERLKSLAAEIADREANLDAEDLAALTDVQARKNQLGLLTSKASTAATARVAAADAALAALGLDGEAASLFNELVLEHRASIAAALSPFCRTAAAAAYLGERLDSMLLLRRYMTLASHAPTPTGASDFAAVLELVAAGNPPWKFDGKMPQTEQ